MAVSGGTDDAFEYNNDSVVAKLSIEVPSGAVDSLQEINQQAEQLRVQLESIARAESNWIEYLQQIPQLTEQAASAQRSLITQLERTSYLQQQIGSMPGGAGAGSPGGGGYSTAAQPGYSDPFSGATAGLAGSSRGGGGEGMGMPANAARAEAFASQIEETDPRLYANMQAQRGNGVGEKAKRHLTQMAQYSATGLGSTDAPGMGGGRGGSTGPVDAGNGGSVGTPGDLATALDKETGLAGMLRKSGGVAGGAGYGGVARLLGKGADAAGTEGGIMGALGGMGSLAKGGLVGGGLLAAGMQAQNLGESYQATKNLGMIRGGGFKEGAGLQGEALMMSLNPFIDLEQSRQIMQAGLKEGYTGKSFDTITKFMADNLKNMNMAQPVSSLVLTPTGWAKMGELTVGDQVIAGDGSSTEVTKVSERGINEVYEVGFSDGTSTRCTMDHLWLVYQTNETVPRVKFLKDLVDDRRKNSSGLFRANGTPRYSVPLVKPVQFPEQELPIDPYTLGVLLGDGSFGHGHVSVHCYEDSLHDLVLPDGVVARKTGSGEYRLTGEWNRWSRNPLMVALEELGLGGVTTPAKFIPEQYFRGSIDQRFALLQGLIDTDGHVDKNGIVFFTNTSSALISDVRSLVQSLGGTVTVKEVQPHQTVMKDGHAINSGACFRMQIRTPGSLGAPCRLPRKADRHVPRMITDRKRTKSIVSVVQVEDEDCRCIRVSNPGRLYVTDDYIVTHNSVSDSVSLLRSNVDKGKMSIGDLGKNLSGLREASKTGRTSLPDKIEEYKEISEKLAATGIDSNGAGGDVLGQNTRMLQESFKDDKLMNGAIQKLIPQLMNTSQFQAMMGIDNKVKGFTTPDTVIPKMMEQRMDPTAGAFESLQKYVNRAVQSSQGDPQTGVSHFRSMMQSALGVNLDQPTAEAIYFAFQGTGGTQAAQRGNAIASDTRAKGDVHDQNARMSPISRMNDGWAKSGLKNVMSDVGEFMTSAEGPGFTDILKGLPSLFGASGSHPRLAREAAKQEKENQPGYQYENVGAPQQDPNRVKRDQEVQQPQKPVQTQGTVTGQVVVRIDSQGRATTNSPVIQLTGTQKSVNAGGGSSTMNNPGPGQDHTHTGWSDSPGRG